MGSPLQAISINTSDPDPDVSRMSPTTAWRQEAFHTAFEMAHAELEVLPCHLSVTSYPLVRTLRIRAKPPKT